jgi:hypothetical protein
MVLFFRRSWNRWQGWALPTKIGVIGSIATLLGVSLGDVRHAVIPRIWPQTPAELPMPVVRIDNPGKADAAISYRGELFLWLPAGLFSAPHVPGTYEIVASDAGLVHPGLVKLPAGRKTRLVLKLMNQEGLRPLLKRGDAEIDFLFRRLDGSSFFSSELPFTEAALKKYYAEASIAEQ